MGVLCYNTDVAVNEKKFQTFFSKWVLYQFPYDVIEKAKYGIAYDLKVVSGLSLAPSKVYPHQVANLIMAGDDRGCHGKIADAGPAQKPFDGFLIRNGYGFLGILYKKDTPDERFFGLFDMQNWDGKSITPERCDVIFSFTSFSCIPKRISL